MGLVLDIGCGDGNSLREEMESATAVAAQQMQAIGVDFDLLALQRGKQKFPAFHFVCARGEQLPFVDQSFDKVISRVAIPYMDVPITLREVARILKPNCDLHMKVFPFTYTLSELLSELRHGPPIQRAKNALFRLYVFANGLALNLFGINFHFPGVPRFRESFQTKRGIQRAAAAAGFRRSEIPCWVTTIDRPHSGNCRVTATR